MVLARQWATLYAGRSTTTNAGGFVLLLLLLATRRVEVAPGSARRGGGGRSIVLFAKRTFVPIVRTVLFSASRPPWLSKYLGVRRQAWAGLAGSCN